VVPAPPCTPHGGRFLTEIVEEIVCALCPSCSSASNTLLTILGIVVVGSIVMTGLYLYNRATRTIVLTPSDLEHKDRD